jgi:O-antigen/teichoic acid export membrane protein
VIKHLSSSIAASVVILFFTAIGGVLSARYLLPIGKGELTAVILWPTLLATIGNLGLVDAVTYYSARHHDDSRQILSTALALALGASAVLVAAGYFLLPVLLSKYGTVTVQSARSFLVYIPISLAATLMMATLQGNLRLGAYNALRAMVQILTVAGMLLAVVVGRATVWGFVAATLTANILTFSAATLVVLKTGWLRWPFPSVSARPLLRFGLQSQLGSLASVLNLRLDQMLMSTLMSAPLLGIYVVAVTVAGLATVPPATLGVIAAPRISWEQDPAARLHSWGRLLRFSVLLQLIFACALWTLAPSIVQLAFGPGFGASASVSRILIVASFPLGLNTMLAIGFRAFNRPLTPSTAETVSLGTTVIGLWLLLPRYGILGAAWASLVAYSVTCGYLFSRVYTQLGITPLELLEPRRKDWRDAWALFLRHVPEVV